MVAFPVLGGPIEVDSPHSNQQSQKSAVCRLIRINGTIIRIGFYLSSLLALIFQKLHLCLKCCIGKRLRILQKNKKCNLTLKWAHLQIPKVLHLPYSKTLFHHKFLICPMAMLEHPSVPKYDFWSNDFLSSRNFGQVTDIQKAMHMSPTCIRTGGLKNTHWIKEEVLGPIQYLLVWDNFGGIQNSLCFSTWKLKSLPNAVDLWSNIIVILLSSHIPSLLEPLLITAVIKLKRVLTVMGCVKMVAPWQ